MIQAPLRATNAVGSAPTRWCLLPLLKIKLQAKYAASPCGICTCSYYVHSDQCYPIADGNCRRYWKQWRWPRTKIKNLLVLVVGLVNQAVSNAWLVGQGLLSVNALWRQAPGRQGYEEWKSLVERANSLDFPQRTRTVGGVGATVRRRCLAD